MINVVVEGKSDEEVARRLIRASGHTVAKVVSPIIFKSKIKESRVPRDPESLTNAKHVVLALCANSRSRAMRQELVAPGSKIGPLYPL
jgi:hypothetical protein